MISTDTARWQTIIPGRTVPLRDRIDDIEIARRRHGNPFRLVGNPSVRRMDIRQQVVMVLLGARHDAIGQRVIAEVDQPLDLAEIPGPVVALDDDESAFDPRDFRETGD
ncbi:MAG: hypothetical protein WD795_02540 [Woeseia sp.]